MSLLSVSLRLSLMQCQSYFLSLSLTHALSLTLPFFLLSLSRSLSQCSLSLSHKNTYIDIYIYAVRPLRCLHFWLFSTKTTLLFFWGGDMRNYPGLCDRFRPSSSLLRSVSVTNVYLSLSPNPPKTLNPKLDPNPKPQHKFKP